MKIRRMKEIVDQFGLRSGIRVLLAEAARRFLDPSLLVSYSQTGEDRIISAMLGEKRCGFYVDIGCNHATTWSNTFALYRRGWTGVTVDGSAEMIDSHRRLRRHDSSVCALVSDEKRMVDFVVFHNSCLSSLSSSHVEKYSGTNGVKEIRRIETRSLTEILDECKAPQQFDLLSIDVEGHDVQVLRSLDFKKYRPNVVVVEMHDFSLEDPHASEVYRLMIELGYKFVAFAMMNGYFCDNL